MPTRKLFISYRSSDAVKVDKIAHDLALLKFEDNVTLRFIPWQDKHSLPPASAHWWDAIVKAIDECDIFVFHISKECLKSEVCRGELEYAHECNLPIIPVVLEGEFFLDPKSHKYNIDYWEELPEWLRDSQLLFHTGASFIIEFQRAVKLFEQDWPMKISARRPRHPNSKDANLTNHAVYDAACEYAGRLAFREAEERFASLVRRHDNDYKYWAAEWLEILRRYAELIEIDGLKNARPQFKKKWAEYVTLFPKEFLDVEIFDPRKLQDGMNVKTGTESKLVHPAEPGDHNTEKTPTKTDNSEHFSPDDLVTKSDFAKLSIKNWIVSFARAMEKFSWIEIHKGKYRISKYPVTNEQFSAFIKSMGYLTPRWWSNEGWDARERGLVWTDRKYLKSTDRWLAPLRWNGSDPLLKPYHPVTGISWYEALAFCNWLSDETGERIGLPTTRQWEYAAAGDEGFTYPWGQEWDWHRCNHSVPPQKSLTTTDVDAYLGKGDSPFGVVDMAGNVSEWCHDMPTQETCWVRGGAYILDDPVMFSSKYQMAYHPVFRTPYIGFRIVAYEVAPNTGNPLD